MNNWFKVKIRAQKMCEDGVQRNVSEEYLIDAMSWTEAETKIIEELQPFYTEFSITDIRPYKVSESFLSETGDRYYRSKLEYITRDEKSGREKKQGVFFLVQASTIDEAKDIIASEMKNTMIDYNLVKIEETKILDLFTYKAEQDGQR